MKKQGKSYLKYVAVAALSFVMLFAAGCSEESNEPKAGELPIGSIADYMSPKADTFYEYEGIGNELAAWKIYYDYIHEGESYQRRIYSGEAQTAEVLVLSEDRLTLTFGFPNYAINYDLSTISKYQDAIIIKTPIEKGNKWTRMTLDQTTTTGESVRYTETAEITEVHKSVTVPYGTFDAIEIRVTNSDDSTEKFEYFVNGLGFIKAEYVLGTERVSTELASITEGFTLEQEVGFFFPAENDEGGYGLDYEVRSISLKTNTDMTKLLEDELKKASAESGNTPILPAGVTINSYIIDPFNSICRVDFSANYPELLSKDPAMEGALMMAMVNTLSSYSGMERVAINVEGAGYESANFSFGKHDYQTPLVPEVSEGEGEDVE